MTLPANAIDKLIAKVQNNVGRQGTLSWPTIRLNGSTKG